MELYLVLHTGNKRDLWKLCVELLHGLLYIIFIDPEKDIFVVGLSCEHGWTQNFSKIFGFILHLYLAGLSERGRWCGEQSSALALKEEVPPKYPQVQPWMWASSPLPLVVWYSQLCSAVGSNDPYPEQWSPTPNKGMQISSCVSKSMTR